MVRAKQGAAANALISSRVCRWGVSGIITDLSFQELMLFGDNFFYRVIVAIASVWLTFYSANFTLRA